MREIVDRLNQINAMSITFLLCLPSLRLVIFILCAAERDIHRRFLFFFRFFFLILFLFIRYLFTICCNFKNSRRTMYRSIFLNQIIFMKFI